MQKPDPVDYFSKVQDASGWSIILKSFARFIAPAADTKILDVGTGPGLLVNILREEYNVFAVGIDFNFLMVKRALLNHSNLGKCEFACAQLPNLPFAASVFDMITATNVLYLIDNPMQALKEIVRLLVPNGELLMLNPSPRMSQKSATLLAGERNMQGFQRENFINWGIVAEANKRWSKVDIDMLFAESGLQLTEIRERIGSGLVLYARGRKI